jgi:peptide/nickel transport system ATP-binding protein
MLEPEVLIADEPVSALDVTIQAQILKLIKDLQASQNFTLIFISHDLAVVNAICNEVVVMRKGQIVERGATQDVLRSPQHAYTQQLLASIPGSPSFERILNER